MTVLKSDEFTFACLPFCLFMVFDKVKYGYFVLGFSKKKYSVNLTNLERRKCKFVLHGQDSTLLR